METMSSSIEPVVPRTANLLACKQWWRVCFLYGDQQKYYRQVYGKAAAQRLALSTTTTSNDTETAANENDNQTTTTNIDVVPRNYDSVTDFIEAQLDELQDASNDNSRRDNNNENSHVTGLQRQQENPPVALFPAKCQSTSTTTASMTLRKSKKLLRSLRKHGHTSNDNKKRQQHRGDMMKHNKRNGRQSKELRETLHQLQALTLVPPTGEATKSNARVTVLDDPFLFGIDDDHLGDLIRRKQYPISATDDISKYFNYYVDQQQQPLPQTLEAAATHELEETDMKPALPPKKKQCPAPATKDTKDLQLNPAELQFLNLSLRSRSWPRPPTTSEKLKAHDINFTFTEIPSMEDETSATEPAQGNLNLEEGLTEEFRTENTISPEQNSDE